MNSINQSKLSQYTINQSNYTERRQRDITLEFTHRTITSNSFMSFMELEERLQQAKEVYSTDKNLQSQMTNQINTTFYNTHQTSSAVTIFALVNSMTGSVILLIPISFMRSGLILSIIAMIVIGFVSYITSRWILKVAEDADGIGTVIKRILGQQYFKLFSATSVILMFGVGIVYFLLLNSTLYHVLGGIFYYCKFYDIASATELKFSSFSIQWQALLLSFLFFPLFFVKRISFLVKLGRIGTFALYAYIIFIFYLFVDNISSGRLQANWDDVRLFSPDFASILGNLSLAFMSQNSIIELMSINKKKENNQRDLKYAYILIQIVYGTIGIFGALGLVGRISIVPPVNIYDFFQTDPGNIPVMIMGFFFLLQIGTVYPFFNFISKVQLFNIIQPDEPISFTQNYIYNIIFTLTCLLIQIFLVNPSMIVGICGSIFGFVLIYLIPIQLRVHSDVDVNMDELLKQNDINNYPQLRNTNSKTLQTNAKFNISQNISQSFLQTENNTVHYRNSNKSNNNKKKKVKLAIRKHSVDSELVNYQTFKENCNHKTGKSSQKFIQSHSNSNNNSSDDLNEKLLQKNEQQQNQIQQKNKYESPSFDNKFKNNNNEEEMSDLQQKEKRYNSDQYNHKNNNKNKQFQRSSASDYENNFDDSNYQQDQVNYQSQSQNSDDYEEEYDEEEEFQPLIQSKCNFIRQNKLLSLGIFGLLLLGSILSMVQIFKIFNLI